MATTPGQPPNGAPVDAHSNEDSVLTRQAPSLLSRLKYATSMCALKTVLSGMHTLREWKEARNPPDGCPDIIKTYDCRPDLPVR